MSVHPHIAGNWIHWYQGLPNTNNWHWIIFKLRSPLLAWRWRVFCPSSLASCWMPPHWGRETHESHAAMWYSVPKMKWSCLISKQHFQPIPIKLQGNAVATIETLKESCKHHVFYGSHSIQSSWVHPTQSCWVSSAACHPLCVLSVLKLVTAGTKPNRKYGYIASCWRQAMLRALWQVDRLWKTRVGPCY